MSILINNNTRLLVQGITGRDGSFHTRQMLDYGTNVVAGDFDYVTNITTTVESKKYVRLIIESL